MRFLGSVVRFLNSPANQGRVSSEIIFIKAMRFQKEIPAKPGRVSSENFKFSLRLYHFPTVSGVSSESWDKLDRPDGIL